VLTLSGIKVSAQSKKKDMKNRTEILAFLRKRKIVVAVAAIIAALLLVDIFVGLWQDGVLREKESRIKRLEEQAFRMLSVDIRDIAEAEGIDATGQYTVVIRIDNVGEEPAYLSHPTVKAYIQTGTISWTEVPVAEMAGEKQEQVYKIREGYLLFKKTLTVPRSLPYNKYLIPKYMHVRFYVTMNVLPESGFKEGEVVERKNDIYVYLKPYWITMREIAEAIDFGETKIPVYMPISAFRNWTQAK
jgi:hypothetical protein